MTIRQPGVTHAISDTGPLISIFQSNSLDLVTTLLPAIHIPIACEEELIRHGWGEICLQQGTHYSEAFIEQIHLAAKGDR